MGRFYDATYGRLFAAGYDWMLGDCERAGLADLRRDLVARAAGATVEVGAGTGLNLSYYPDTVPELVLTELRHGATAAGPVHRSGPVGGGGRGLGRAVAVRRGVVRHRGGHPRAVHGARGGGGARRDQAGASARTGGCSFSSMSARPIHGSPAGRTAGSVRGGCSAPAVTATATSRARSPRAGSAWSGALLGRCRRPHRSSGR